MTAEELADATAVYFSWTDAKTAADAAMPRRKHNRPYPAASGYYWAKYARDAWIVWTGNAVLLRDGTMYDYQRQTVIRP